VLVSDFAGAELASAIARRVRMGELSADEARSYFVYRPVPAIGW
jgi:hypothetical protein